MSYVQLESRKTHSQGYDNDRVAEHGVVSCPDPSPESGKRVWCSVEYLATVSPKLELANDSLCKACFTKHKKAATYLAAAENITNELREKFAFGL